GHRRRRASGGEGDGGARRELDPDRLAVELEGGTLTGELTAGGQLEQAAVGGLVGGRIAAAAHHDADRRDSILDGLEQGAEAKVGVDHPRGEEGGEIELRV